MTVLQILRTNQCKTPFQPTNHKILGVNIHRKNHSDKANIQLQTSKSKEKNINIKSPY